MSDRTLCEAHAEWFGELLKELVIPIARDFMAHGLKHEREERVKPNQVVWESGEPLDAETVWVARFGFGFDVPVYSLDFWTGECWMSAVNAGPALTGVVGWCRLPKWEVPDATNA